MNHRRLEEDMALASEQRRFEAVQLGAMEAEEAEMREASRYCPLKHDSLHAVLPCCVVAADHCDHCAHTAAPAALFICVPFVYVCVCVCGLLRMCMEQMHTIGYELPMAFRIRIQSEWAWAWAWACHHQCHHQSLGSCFFFLSFFFFFCAFKCVVLVFHFSIRK